MYPGVAYTQTALPTPRPGLRDSLASLVQLRDASLRRLTPTQLNARAAAILRMRVRPRQMPAYTFDPLQTTIALKCEYGKAEILNLADWDTTRRWRRPTRIEVVYTQYPRDTAAWLTPYGRLMSERINNLLAHAPALADTAVRWELVAQTEPRTAAQARAAFHGFVIHYKTDERRMPKDDPQAHQEQNLGWVRRIIGGSPLPDSIIIRALQRHPEWQNLTVVLDWTGSMYPYGAEVMRWHRILIAEKEKQRTLIRNLVLFNDGDDWLHGGGVLFRDKPIGRTGGIYTCDAQDLAEVVSTMEQAMMSGDGSELTENNVEALLYAQREYPSATRLLMIADNNSAMRDIQLLQQLKKPVDIIMCGVSHKRPLNRQLMLIAWHTGGSLITEKDEVRFAAPQTAMGEEGITLYGRRFVMKNGRFFAR